MHVLGAAVVVFLHGALDSSLSRLMGSYANASFLEATMHRVGESFYANLLVYENRWRAQRYGIDGTLIDFGRGQMVPYPQLLEELLAYIMEDAEHFGCVDEVKHAYTILERGTSAHWQRKTYREAKAAGASDREAIKAVVDMLIEETMHGL